MSASPSTYADISEPISMSDREAPMANPPTARPKASVSAVIAAPAATPTAPATWTSASPIWASTAVFTDASAEFTLPEEMPPLSPEALDDTSTVVCALMETLPTVPPMSA